MTHKKYAVFQNDNQVIFDRPVEYKISIEDYRLVIRVNEDIVAIFDNWSYIRRLN